MLTSVVFSPQMDMRHAHLIANTNVQIYKGHTLCLCIATYTINKNIFGDVWLIASAKTNIIELPTSKFIDI